MATVSGARTEPREALDRGVAHLLERQSADGWWKGELETNVTIDAEDLLLREFLGIRTAAQTEPTARWIRSRQREDGSWANFHGGPPDVSTTVEAYAALRLAGDDPAAPHMAAARACILGLGGLERARVFTKIWLALFGLWSWEHVPELPPELILAPPWMPLNVYDFACWARQTIVALTIVSAERPVRRVGFGLDELRAGGDPVPAPRDGWERLFTRLDRALRGYRRLHPRRLRERAMAEAERWIVERQEADGSWGGIQPPWVYSLIALSLRGYDFDHPAMRRGLEGLEGFTILEDGVRRIEACQSPVWDTGLAVIALADAGLPPDHPAMAAAARWLLGEEIGIHGDWAVRRPRLRPAGWAFEFANDHYPDIDDTAEVVLALDRVRGGGVDVEPAIRRGAAWVAGMESRGGGWGAFDADNTRALCRKPPFCDFGEVIDPPSADVTAHVVEMLAVLDARPKARARGVRWLLREQEADGSWFGRWGANHVYGTGHVMPALAAAGVAPHHPAMRAGVRWLLEHQNPDGGWGEDLRSYVDPEWRGRGASTASQTAWALLGLLAAGERGEPARRGVEWLCAAQTADGGWDEPLYTGTGFPGFFYINYHLYRVVFPVMALGRWVRGEV
jgi:squalene-hopene/tetraprenyl-beta-curcumene cyclase